LKKIIVSLFLTGCTLGPNYKPPESEISDQWQEVLEVASQESPLVDWWRLFQEPLLDKYIEMATASNFDLLALEANILEARAFRMMAAAPLFPQLIGDINATKSYFSKNGPVFAIGVASGSSTGGGGTTTSGTVAPTTSGVSSPLTGLPFTVQIPQKQNLYNVLLDASWEIDFFGRTRRSVEAAEATIQMTMEARHDLLLTLLAEIASHYIEIRSFQTQATLIEENIYLLEKESDIVRHNKEEGLDNQLELERIEAQLATARANLPTIIAQVYRAIYALSVLTGNLPEVLAEELLPLQPLPILPAKIAMGLRSDLMRRRPDVRLAERQLAQATANIGVAVASFFPTFTLLGDVGLQSLLFPKLFQANSKTWAYGGDLSIPIFQGGSLVGNLRATKAAEKSAAYHYQQIVLNAAKEAESALVTYHSDVKKGNDFLKSVKHYRSLVDLTEQRYDLGLTSSLPLLDSQRQLNAAEQNLVEIQTTTLLDLIALYKSLGGGWELF